METKMNSDSGQSLGDILRAALTEQRAKNAEQKLAALRYALDELMERLYTRAERSAELASRSTGAPSIERCVAMAVTYERCGDLINDLLEDHK